MLHHQAYQLSYHHVLLLQPVMPQIAEKILNSLGQKSVELFGDQLQWGSGLAGSSYGEKSILFPKKER